MQCRRSTDFFMFPFKYQFILCVRCAKLLFFGELEQDLVTTLDGYDMAILLTTILLVYSEDR